jgi:hypothetical protein
MSNKLNANQAQLALNSTMPKTAIHHSLFDALPDSAFVRQSQLIQSSKRPGTLAPWPFSAPTYWRKVADGTLPKPYKLSARVSAQNVGECRAISAAWAAGKTDSEMRQLVTKLHAKRLEV